MQNRFCIIDPSGELLQICLQSNNALNIGADFKVIDPTNSKVLEGIKLTVDDTGRGCKNITTPVASLDNKGLSWQILVCSLNEQIDTGTIELIINQSGVSCPLTNPTRWELNSIPQCGDGNAIPINGGLIFLFKK